MERKNNIHPDVQSYIKHFQQGEAVTGINLSKKNLTDQDLAALLPHVKQAKGLTALWLSDNQITDTGAQALAETLKENGSLIVLNLYNNQITDKQLYTQIQASLKNNVEVAQKKKEDEEAIKNLAQVLSPYYQSRSYFFSRLPVELVHQIAGSAAKHNVYTKKEALAVARSVLG